MNDDYKWPEKGEHLFKSDMDWWLNACVNDFGNKDYLYIEGYVEAANIISKHVIDHDRMLYILIYPLIFLYRHSIELGLKRILNKGGNLFNQEVSIKMTHRLDNLWITAKGIILKIQPSIEKKELDAMGDLVMEFMEYDPTSTTFRYSTTKDGIAINTGLEVVNVRNLSKVMEGIFNFISGTNALIDDLNSNRGDQI